MESSADPPNTQECKMLSFLWRVIICTILNPLFASNNRPIIPTSSEENQNLSPFLLMHRFDKNLFPFIHERLPSFLSNYYTENALVSLHAETDGFNMLASLQEWWDVCAQKTSRCLEEVLKPLELAHRQVVREFQFTSIREVVIHQFQKSVFNPLAVSVQQYGFSCISRDGIITNRDGLWAVHTIIESISSNTIVSSIIEWDRPVMAWLFESIEDTVDAWNTTSVKSFLSKVYFRLLEYRSIFLYKETEFEAKRRFLYATSNLRDRLLFNNDAANLRILLQNEESAPQLQLLFRFFYEDKNFLQAVSVRAFECFKEFLAGKDQDSDKEPLSKERFFRRFLVTWRRMNLIQKGFSSNTRFAEAILTPLTRIVGNSSKTLEPIFHTQRFLAKHCHSLLSTSSYGKQILATSKEEEIFEIVSLAGFMRSTDVFFDAHRPLLSKRLLSGTSVCPSLENEVVKALSKHDEVLAHRIKVILSDAEHWSDYQREFSSASLSQCNGITVETKIINRTYWHLEDDVDVVLHPQCQIISEKFSGYFKSKYPERSCSVQSTAGHATIRTEIWEFNGNPVRLMLTTCQLSLLSLFEKSKKLSVKQIYMLLLNSGGISRWEFVLNLIRSMTEKTPVLTKEPGLQNILETDTIRLNRDFRPANGLITLPIPEACKKSTEGSAMVEKQEDLREFRKQYFESTIVKVLKEHMMIELNVLKKVVYSEVGLKLNLSDESFEETVKSLEKREFLTVDGSTVRYAW